MFKRCFSLMLALCLLLTGSSVAFMEELNLDSLSGIEALEVDDSVLVQAEDYVEETESDFGFDEEAPADAVEPAAETPQAEEPAAAESTETVAEPAADETDADSAVIAEAAEADGAITEFALSGKAKYTVSKGTVFQITLGDKVAKKYKSSKKKVASVTSTGLVTAKAAGKTKITVTLSKKKKYTLTLKVVDPTKPTKVYLTKDGVPVSGTITVNKNEPILLVPVAESASGIADTNFKWKSSKKKVASVSGGIVTPKKAGKAKITVTTTRGKKKASIKVKVVDPFKATSVSLNETGLIYVFLGEKLQLTATMEPANSTSTLKWKSSKKKVASVSKTGLVKAKKKGKAVITVKTSSGKKARVTVKVIPRGGPATDLMPEWSPDDASHFVYVGTVDTYVISTIPFSADANIVWTTGDSNILTVVDSARSGDLRFWADVQGQGVGSTTLTATDTNTGLSRSVVLSVLEPPAPESISLPNGGTVYMSVGEVRDIPYVVNPATSLNNSYNALAVNYDHSLALISYDSQNYKRNCLGTMDYNLHVTANAPGTTTVTLTLKNGVTASFTLVIQ